MDLASPSFPHLPGDQFCERTVRRDHRAGPLWPITWTPPSRGEPFPALVPSNNKGQVFPVEVLCLALRRFEEAKSLLRKTMPVARRVLGDSHDLTIQMRARCARALYKDPGATLDDLREAVTTLEDTERIARRVFGGAHPFVVGIEGDLRKARAVLRARETPQED